MRKRRVRKSNSVSAAEGITRQSFLQAFALVTGAALTQSKLTAQPIDDTSLPIAEPTRTQIERALRSIDNFGRPDEYLEITEAVFQENMSAVQFVEKAADAIASRFRISPGDARAAGATIAYRMTPGDAIKVVRSADANLYLARACLLESERQIIQWQNEHAYRPVQSGDCAAMASQILELVRLMDRLPGAIPVPSEISTDSRSFRICKIEVTSRREDRPPLVLEVMAEPRLYRFDLPPLPASEPSVFLSGLDQVMQRLRSLRSQIQSWRNRWRAVYSALALRQASDALRGQNDRERAQAILIGSEFHMQRLILISTRALSCTRTSLDWEADQMEAEAIVNGIENLLTSRSSEGKPFFNGSDRLWPNINITTQRLQLVDHARPITIAPTGGADASNREWDVSVMDRLHSAARSLAQARSILYERGDSL